MQAVSNEAKAVEVAATFQTIEEAATKLDGAREEAAATMDAVAQVQNWCEVFASNTPANHPLQSCTMPGCCELQYHRHGTVRGDGLPSPPARASSLHMYCRFQRWLRSCCRQQQPSVAS